LVAELKGGKMKSFSEFFLGLYLKVMSALRSEKGQTLVEYALLLVLIAIVVYLMLKGTGLEVNRVYSKINSALGAP
jgi:pilus assembly protein Flp/PilA